MLRVYWHTVGLQKTLAVTVILRVTPAPSRLPEHDRFLLRPAHCHLTSSLIVPAAASVPTSISGTCSCRTLLASPKTGAVGREVSCLARKNVLTG